VGGGVGVLCAWLNVGGSVPLIYNQLQQCVLGGGSTINCDGVPLIFVLGGAQVPLDFTRTKVRAC
jgi:hypothetical protein